MRCVFLLLILLLPSLSFAKSITYDIGTTGYMLREAMQAQAPRLATEEYRQALQYQTWAKQALRGEYVVKEKKISKKIRSRMKAMQFTKQAYTHAKNARDAALKLVGKQRY